MILSFCCFQADKKGEKPAIEENAFEALERDFQEVRFYLFVDIRKSFLCRQTFSKPYIKAACECILITCPQLAMVKSSVLTASCCDYCNLMASSTVRLLLEQKYGQILKLLQDVYKIPGLPGLL